MATPSSPKRTLVFVDTNLDTHLAINVSDHDTFSDFKKKILSQHHECYPEFGQIQVNGIKMKNEEYLYCLSSSMLVRDTFHCFYTRVAFSVDVSALGDCRHNEQLFSHASPDRLDSLAIANCALVDNGITLQSNFQLQQLEKKSEQIPVISSCVTQDIAKEAVTNLEGAVKSTGDNDKGVPLPSSAPETGNCSHVNHDDDKGIPLPSSAPETGNRSHVNHDNDTGIPLPCSAPETGNRSHVNHDNGAGIPLPSSTPEIGNRSHVNHDNDTGIPLPSSAPETGNHSYVNHDNDTEIPLPSPVPETDNRCHVNQEVTSSHIQCEVDVNQQVPSSHIQCEADGSHTRKQKRKKKKSRKGNTVGGNNSKDNTAFVDNPLSSASERAASFNNFPVLKSEIKHDGKEEIRLDDVPCVSEHVEKAVKNLEMDTKSSGNNDRAVLFPGSITETRDNFCVNHELPNSHIECEVDGSYKGTKDDCIAGEEGTSKPVPSAKKKHKSKKRKREDTAQDDTSKENDASVVVPGDYTAQQAIVVQTNSSENAYKDVSKETEALKEHLLTECKNNSSKNDTDAVSMKEASEPTPAVNKKHKKRKTRDSEELLKAETTPQKDAAHMSHEAPKETKDLQNQFELNNNKPGDAIEYKHNETEDILDTRPPEKKRKKGREKKREKTLSNKKLANDLNGDNSSHHLLEGQQNIKNGGADQSAEHFNAANQHCTSMLEQRKKGKVNYSNLHETPVVTSSREDGEANHSSIQREDVITSKKTLDKMEIGIDAHKETIQSAVKRKGSYENQCDIEMKLQPSDVEEPKDLTEDNENAVLGHCQDHGTGQTVRAEKGIEVLLQNDPKVMPLERRTPSNQDNTNSDTRELKMNSNVVDMNGMKEPVKSDKKKRGVKKAKSSGGGLALGEDIFSVDASESEKVIAKSLKATIQDPISANTETEENPLNQTEGEQIQREEMHGTKLSVTDKKDEFGVENSGSLDQIKTKSNAENVDEHVDNSLGKKSNNKQGSTSKIALDMQTKDQVLVGKKEHDVHRSHLGQNELNALKTVQDSTLSSRSDSAMSLIGETKLRVWRDNASGKVNDLERQREHIPVSKSKLEGSNKMVQNKAREASRNDARGVMSKMQPKKGLGEIFEDDSSGTSEGEDHIDDSDATRPPSDNSLLSDNSDGYNSPDVDSQQNGLYSGKRLENGERSSLKTSLSGTKGMPIDRVLRSSTRYKKAKITASQMDESESQPDFVPDSLFDTQ